MRVLRWALAGGLAACFDPTTLDGVVACGPAPDVCPPDMVCRADNLCWSTASAAPDAPDAPATLAPDAKPSAPDARRPACSDGIDNDCDGLTDWPDDPGCSGPDDDDEHGDLECDDGIDNDHDGRADFHIGTRCGPGDDMCKSIRDKEGKPMPGPGPGPGPG